MPARQCSNVDLPEPLGPMTATTRIQDLIDNFQTGGGYAIAVVLAVIAVLVLALMTLTKPKEEAL